LRSAEYVHDAYQKEVIHKKDLFDKIVLMQKKATFFVDMLAKDLNLNTGEKQKINLAILYDLGSLIQKNHLQKNRAASPVFSPVPDEDIKNLVVKTIAEFVHVTHQNSPGLSPEELLKKINTQTGIYTVQQELSSTQNRLEKIRQEQKAFTQTMQKSLESTSSQALETELLLHKSQEEIANYKNKIQQLTQLTMSRKVDESLTEKTFTNKLEEARKASLELQKTLDKTKQEIENVRQETSAKVYTELKQRFMPLLEEKERNNLELELIIQDTKNRTQELAKHVEDTERALQEANTSKQQAIKEFEKELEHEKHQDLIDKEESMTRSALTQELAKQTIREMLEAENREELERELDRIR
jgi:hypothetical protein